MLVIIFYLQSSSVNPSAVYLSIHSSYVHDLNPPLICSHSSILVSVQLFSMQLLDIHPSNSLPLNSSTSPLSINLTSSKLTLSLFLLTLSSFLRTTISRITPRTTKQRDMIMIRRIIQPKIQRHDI